MNILSHRGIWKTPEERNSLLAFDRSFALGFGTETDLRDSDGKLVISHDVPTAGALPAYKIFESLGRYSPALPLALNIKADGLQALVAEALVRHRITNYFLFDMSVPDAFCSLRAGLRIFSRHSDVETNPVLYSDSVGVWMDAFVDDGWITPGVIESHLNQGKQVCLVSPELHRRPYLPFWGRLRASPISRHRDLMLCSDHPEEAALFFQ